MYSDKIYAADLFCGAGGFSSGLLAAATELEMDVDVLAINHWQTAIDTHTLNHPGIRHLCESLDSVDPRRVIDGRLDLLVASPECINHCNARGNRPVNDQSRATAWHVLRWAEALYPNDIIVENVKEFRDWGPLGLDGRPIKSRKGRIYRQFINSLRSLGYSVEDKVLTAADYGDPTTRERLYIRARRTGRIVWPKPTHTRSDAMSDFSTLPWRPAREVIDWDIDGESIFDRKKPLVPKTMNRILTGLRKYSGLEMQPDGTVEVSESGIQPYLVVLRNNCDARSLNEPVPALTGGGTHIAMASPFVVNYKGESIGRAIDEPLPTITAEAAHLYVAEPFILKYYGNGENVHSINEPLDTVTSKARFALVRPVVMMNGKAIGVLDIKFRMLQPHELAKAMSFPECYSFSGTKTDQIKQIGNAIAVRTAAALCKSALSTQSGRKQIVPKLHFAYA